MQKTFSVVNGDNVLDITETKEVTTRLSENKLLANKAYLENAIAKFQADLADVNDKLQMIDEEKNK